SDEDTGQVIANGLRGVAPTDLHQFTAGEGDLEAGDVVDGDAIKKRMRATAVAGDVPSDRAGALAGRVGDVVVAVGFERLAQRQVDDAGLDHRPQVVDIDLEDAVHPGEGDDDTALDRDRAPGQAAGARARRDRHLGVGAHFDDLRDLPRRPGDDDDIRQRRLRAGVVLVE